MVGPPRRNLMLAIHRFDRTAALHSQAVTIDHVHVMHVPPGTSVAGVLNGVFDGAEMPLAHYAFLRSLDAPLTAIPVFPDRLLVQQYIYTRPDAGIRSPAELRGRRVLLPTYYMTASFWHRALLKEDYGIDPTEVAWHTTSAEADPRMRLPDGLKVTITPGPRLGAELLLQGTVDCIMTEATPPVPEEQRSNFVRLLPDFYERQRERLRQTRFHPIVHLIVLRTQALQERPELALELCQAFDRAKQLAYEALENERLISLPLMRAYLDETAEIFGNDPWPYGLEANRAELDTFLGYAVEQGMTERRLAPEELFEPSTRGFQFQARMPSGATPWSIPNF